MHFGGSALQAAWLFSMITILTSHPTREEYYLDQRLPLPLYQRVPVFEAYFGHNNVSQGRGDANIVSRPPHRYPQEGYQDKQIERRADSGYNHESYIRPNPILNGPVRKISNGHNRRKAPTEENVPFYPTSEKTFRNGTLKSLRRSRPKPQGGDIVFPDDTLRFISKGCNNPNNYCENFVDEYPRTHIHRIFAANRGLYKEFFGRIELPEPNITERINMPEEHSLCQTRKQIIYPTAGKNKDDKWLYVINQDDYVQAVAVELCTNPGGTCEFTDGFPLGYEPYCKQNFIERTLVALSDTGQASTEKFLLPSCCNCILKIKS